MHTSQAVLGMLSLTLRLLRLLDGLLFDSKSSESAAKSILKMLRAPKVLIREKLYDAVMLRSLYASYRRSFKEFIRAKSHLDLCGRCTIVCCGLFVRILHTATVKTVDKSSLNEIYSLMNFSILSLRLSSVHDSKSTCIRMRGDM